MGFTVFVHIQVDSQKMVIKKVSGVFFKMENCFFNSEFDNDPDVKERPSVENQKRSLRMKTLFYTLMSLSLSTSIYAQSGKVVLGPNAQEITLEAFELMSLKETSSVASKVNNFFAPEASDHEFSTPADVVEAYTQFQTLFTQSATARTRAINNPCLYSDIITAVAYPNHGFKLNWDAQDPQFELASDILENAVSLRKSAHCIPPTNNRCCKDSSGTPNCDTIKVPASCRIDGTDNCEHSSTMCN